MKPIRFSNHARRRMVLRGANETEIKAAIDGEQWKPALQGKWQVEKKFTFGQVSPINRKAYAFKTLRVIFAEEIAEVVVITVIVLYGNEE